MVMSHRKTNTRLWTKAQVDYDTAMLLETSRLPEKQSMPICPRELFRVKMHFGFNLGLKEPMGDP